MLKTNSQPDSRYRIGSHLNLTAEKIEAGQDLQGLAMCFFRLNETPLGSNWNVLAQGVGPRIRIQGVTISERPALPKPYFIKAKPVQPSAPEWGTPEVA